MATKRTKRSATPVGISAAAIEAWRIGDWHELNRLLGIAPCDVSPFDAIGPLPSWCRTNSTCWCASWPRGVALRKRLIEVAGPPGGVGRHSEPLGPGVASYRDRDEDEQEEDDP
jgi:hypothetical protein